MDAAEHAAPATIPLHGASGQTDILMPIFRAYRKTRRVGESFDICLANLAVVASQALWVAGREPAPALLPLLQTIREHCPPIGTTRNLGLELRRWSAH